MKKLLLSVAVLFWLTLISTSVTAQTPWPVLPIPSCTQSYRVVVLGSSTSFGTGATIVDSGWSNKFRLYIQRDNALVTFTNLSLGGFTTYHVNPSSYIPPVGKPAPDVSRNITAALALSPDAIVINLPTNDAAAVFSLQETQDNLNRIVAAADAQNVPVWVATSQPRNGMSAGQINLLTGLRDWTYQRFGVKAIDFWTDIASGDGSINPTYSAGDGVHLNNLGHHVLFTRVLNEKIWDSICFRKNGTSNSIPSANAGNDISITFPTNSVTLNGTGSDLNGTISSYAWSKVYGPSAGTFSAASQSTTQVTSLSAGSYLFRLIVTDNNGARASDDVAVTVIDPNPPNQLPIVNAGADVTISLPINTVTLSGTASDPDGTIASYLWSRVSGPTTFTIASATTASTAINGLVAGTYIFRLTVTDNRGGSRSDDVQVTVQSSTASVSDVMDPADPDVVFTTGNQPAAPAWNNYNVVKWGHTARLGWNPYNQGYRSYIFQSMAFRLKFPKTYQHKVADGKKYPLFIFFHGRGEAGTIYDNEYQLLHGGQLHAQKVNDGTFDGFLFYAQSTSGNSQDYLGRISALIDTLVKYNKVDIDRVVVSGLSAGGASAWDILANSTYARKVAASIPISAASTASMQYFPSYVQTPIWISNGGQDAGPAPYTVNQLINEYRRLGGKIDQTFFPSLGHGVWNNFWATPGYFQFLGQQHKANPLVYFQRYEFCPNVTVSAQLGVHAGFFTYEWQKDGQTIPGAISNILQVNSYGTYRVRYKRTSTSDWSEWSPSPAVISVKQATVSPPIETNGLFSTVLPAPDGSNSVSLMVPNTYAGYEWRRVSDNAVVSTTSTYTAPVGEYKVMVTEQFGCSSNFSPNFAVISANGNNLPDAASNVLATALSSTEININWSDNPNPLNDETAFEIYRSTTPGSNYKLVAIKGANVLLHSDNDLVAKTKYYYIIRAINANGASAVSSEVSATTFSDVVAPTAPANLRVTASTRSTISVTWDPSTDDVGVDKYDVYIDGVKTYATSKTSITATGLNAFQTYAIFVKARDLSGNQSPQSNQVSGTAALNGLYYKYYQGNWSALPDFNTLTPVATGVSPTPTLTPRLRNDNFGFLWEGYINIPVTGSYTFETNSDDGSKLYIGQYSHTAIALVNNDGLHGSQFRSGTITLAAGTYPIAITFFEQGGGEAMNVYWTSIDAGINTRTLIPASAFADQVPSVTPLLMPSGLLVISDSYKQITLNWTDNSNNESGFEIVRANAANGNFLPIGSVPANATSFVDSVGLMPNAKYWYKVRAISQTSQSEFIGNYEGRWLLNNNYVDATIGNRTLTASGTPTFNSADKKEGSHAISLTSTQGATMAFSSNRAFPSNAYDTRTISLWIKPTSATITGTNKLVFDLGGSDNGLAVRFNTGTLQAGVASANVRNTISLTNVATNPDWVSGGWNHVALVYNRNQLTLYLNGVSKGTASLTFNSIASTTGTSAIGVTNGSNAFNSSTSSTNFNGLIDDFSIITEPLSVSGILALMANGYASGSTATLPSVPAVPSISSVTANSGREIALSFNDNSSDETGFEIYRSIANSTDYRLLANLGSSSGSVVNYIDADLFPNTVYFYKVRSIGVGGSSAFSSDVSAKTLNSAPSIDPIQNFSIRYASQKVISINVADVDGDAITILPGQPLPSFAVFADGGNGSASIQFNPTIADIGVYNISLIARDANNGESTQSFVVTVNSNYVPVFGAIGSVSLNEGATSSVALTATDQDGNGSLSFGVVSGPSFVSLIDNGNGLASVNLAPGFAASGSYPVTVSVSDGAGAFETATFTVNVANSDPTSQVVYMNMQYTSAGASAPWNNINSISKSNLLDSKGQTTGIGIQFLGTNWIGGDAGAVTGNNSGVYPDAVIRDYFWFGAYGQPETVTFNLTGLDPTKKYNITLFGSSAWTGLGNNGTTIYTIGSVSKPLYVDNNRTNTVTFTSVYPNQSGVIAVAMSKAVGTPYGLVTSVVLEQPFDDGTTPILPTALKADAMVNGSVQLTWQDNAYNEERYLVYRSASPNGTYTVLNAGATNANATSFVDNSVASNATYYYKIEAVNAIGTSGLTGEVGILTSNKLPVLSAIANVNLKGGTSSNVNINATDDLGSTLNVSVTGLPAFATYQATGNGTGIISVSPAVSDIGVYKNVIISVTDEFGGVASDTFDISVTDPDIRTVYINFGPPANEGSVVQPAPWNNILSFPYANNPTSNLRDDANVNTGFSIRLMEQWSGTFLLGMTTGYNSGILPDDAMKSSIYTNSASARTIQITGLNPARRYNVAAFSSHNAGQSSMFTLSSGVQSVSMDARYNTERTVQLNGLVPDGSGVLTISMTKNAAAAYLNLNALVIEEYESTVQTLSPANLMTKTILDTSKISLVWSDRSTDETGFVIWRATNPYGPFISLASVPANQTSYTDGTVKSNTRYFYKVQAVNGAYSSGFSNVRSEKTSSRIVFVNLNSSASFNAPSPWNNTNGQGALDAEFLGLRDNAADNSGIDMVVTAEFNAPGFEGVNGAGVFPSSVMRSNYWTDAGMTSGVQFNNLNLRRKYRIGIFGSAISTGYFLARYTANGKTVELNSLYNDSKVVYLYDLVPNENGEIRVEVRNASGSPYCFTSAFTIESYDEDPIYSVPVGTRAVRSNNTVVDMPGQQAPSTLNESGVRAYPNPFTESITIELGNLKAKSHTVVLYDLTGKVVLRKVVAGSSGLSQLRINLDGSVRGKGTYILQVISDGKSSKPIKLLKMQ